MRKAWQAFTGLVIILMLCGGMFLAVGKGYANSGFNHYIGEANLSPEEFVSLAKGQPIGGSPFAIEVEDVLENGSVVIKYDFYSSIRYQFLTSAPFSYLDAPAIHQLRVIMEESPLRLTALFLFLCLALSVIIIIKFNAILQHIPNPDHAVWYITHPRFISEKQLVELSTRTAVIVDKIAIKPGGQGLLAVRTWKQKQGNLYSTGIGQVRWDGKLLFSDKPLSENNSSGIYAYRLGEDPSDLLFANELLGVVSLSGDWYEHRDGVVRAECCEILFLIVSGHYKKRASALSAKYDVPVLIRDHPVFDYMDWVLGDNGLECLKHNNEIIGGQGEYDRKSETEGAIAIEVPTAGNSRACHATQQR